MTLFLHFWSNAVEVPILLGYGATSLGDHCPKFWDSTHLRGSSVKSRRWDNYAVAKYWAPFSDIVAYPKRMYIVNTRFKDNTTWGRKSVRTVTRWICPHFLCLCSAEFVTQSWERPEAPLSFMALHNQYVTRNMKYLLVQGKFQFVRQHCHHYS
jgi:hypothetical protein